MDIGASCDGFSCIVTGGGSYGSAKQIGAYYLQASTRGCQGGEAAIEVLSLSKYTSSKIKFVSVANNDSNLTEIWMYTDDYPYQIQITTLKEMETTWISPLTYQKEEPENIVTTAEVDIPWTAANFTGQFHAYHSNRTYSCGDVCYTEDENGTKTFWQWYSNQESLSGKDPLDNANRPSGWTDTTKPCCWIEYHGNLPGQFAFWPSDDIPENAIKLVDASVDATQFWRIAARHPSLVSDGKINIVAVAGRYIRAAEGSTYPVGITHGDAIRNITGTFKASANDSNDVSGAFTSATYANTAGDDGTTDGNYLYRFDASNVVPTSNQNQPVTAILNPIVYI
ncbi:hypothetical protein P4S72_27110 [Vibrio sp. PP-XX7]